MADQQTAAGSGTDGGLPQAFANAPTPAPAAPVQDSSTTKPKPDTSDSGNTATAAKSGPGAGNSRKGLESKGVPVGKLLGWGVPVVGTVAGVLMYQQSPAGAAIMFGIAFLVLIIMGAVYLMKKKTAGKGGSTRTVTNTTRQSGGGGRGLLRPGSNGGRGGAAGGRGGGLRSHLPGGKPGSKPSGAGKPGGSGRPGGSGAPGGSGRPGGSTSPKGPGGGKGGSRNPFSRNRNSNGGHGAPGGAGAPGGKPGTTSPRKPAGAAAAVSGKPSGQGDKTSRNPFKRNSSKPGGNGAPGGAGRPGSSAAPKVPGATPKAPGSKPGGNGRPGATAKAPAGKPTGNGGQPNRTGARGAIDRARSRMPGNRNNNPGSKNPPKGNPNSSPNRNSTGGNNGTGNGGRFGAVMDKVRPGRTKNTDTSKQQPAKDAGSDKGTATPAATTPAKDKATTAEKPARGKARWFQPHRKIAEHVNRQVDNGIAQQKAQDKAGQKTDGRFNAEGKRRRGHRGGKGKGSAAQAAEAGKQAATDGKPADTGKPDSTDTKARVHPNRQQQKDTSARADTRDGKTDAPVQAAHRHATADHIYLSGMSAQAATVAKRQEQDKFIRDYGVDDMGFPTRTPEPSVPGRHPALARNMQPPAPIQTPEPAPAPATKKQKENTAMSYTPQFAGGIDPSTPATYKATLSSSMDAANAAAAEKDDKASELRRKAALNDERPSMRQTAEDQRREASALDETAEKLRGEASAYSDELSTVAV